MHEVVTVQYQGWADYDDDELIAAAERAFTVLVTLDTNLIHQQDVAPRALGIVVIDVHPVVPDHLAGHAGTVSSALSIAAEEQRTVVVREGGITLLSP